MKLTTRENQVMSLLVTGMSDKEIATQLGISARTVQAHLAHIYRKQKIANRYSAIIMYLQHCSELLQSA